jgi:signal peptidase
MKKRKKWMPEGQSLKRSILLLFMLAGMYSLDNTPIAKFIGNRLFYFLVKPAIYLGVAYIVWRLPSRKPKARLKHMSYLKFSAFNYGVVYVLLNIGAGLLDGFGKSPYDHSVIGIITNLILVGTMLLAVEMIRGYWTLNLGYEENYSIFILLALVMTFYKTPFSKFTSIKEYFDIVNFLASYFAPDFCLNLFAVYLAYLGGPVISIIYLGIIQGFHWFSPILPDLKWITKALIGVLCPIFSLMLLQSSYLKLTRQVKKTDNKKDNPVGWMITSIISIGIIWFTVGVFPVYPSIIATGSMEPLIKPGDVIIVKKVDPETLVVGDIIQFRKDGVLISHRIIDEYEENKVKYYITKGDNNSVADHDPVGLEQIKGKVIHVVPKIGWPSLLIKGRSSVPVDDFEF